jgi:rare lipoprotein A
LVALPVEVKKPVEVASNKPLVKEECTWRTVEASWYGDPAKVLDSFHGRLTASGEKYNTWQNTVAHKTLPFGTKILINSGNGNVVSATVTDRGPFVSKREFDLSYNLATSAQTTEGKKLIESGVGHIQVCM